MAGPRVSPRTQKQRSHARSSTAPSTGDDDGPKPPPFLARLYELVNDPATDKVCSWTETVRMDVPGCVADLPNAFTVHDNRALEKDIIPKHYKHSNFTSFIRQLNQYKFRKLEAKKWTFGHENFVKGRPDLLIHIHRNKKTRPSGTTKREGAAEQSNKLLRNRNDLAHQVSTLTATVQQMAERQRVMEAVLSRISGQVLGTDIIPGLPPMRFPPELAPQPKQNGTKPLLMTGEPTETTMRFNTATQKRQRVASQNQGYSGSGVGMRGAFDSQKTYQRMPTFLRDWAAKTCAHAVMIVVPKSQVAFPEVWRSDKQWPCAGDVDGYIVQLETPEADQRQAWFIELSSSGSVVTKHTLNAMRQCILPPVFQKIQTKTRTAKTKGKKKAGRVR